MTGRRILTALLALVCLAFAAPSWATNPPPLTAAQIVAKGGALKADVPAIVAARGGTYVNLAPIRRSVAASVSQNGCCSSTGSATYTTETFPVAAPTGQTVGAKLVVPVTTNAFAGLNIQAYAASGGATSIPGFVAQPYNTSYIAGILVYFPVEPVSGSSIGLQLEKDGSNNWRMSWSGNCISAGWNFLTVLRDQVGATECSSAWTKTGTIGSGDNFVSARVQMFSAAGGETFHVAEVFTYPAPIAKTVVTLSNDGVYAGYMSIGLPAMQAAGFQGMTSTGSGLMQGSPSNFNALAAAGWDVCRQGVLHINYASSPSQFAIDEPIARSVMSNMGFRGDQLNCITYPFGASNAATRATAIADGVVFQRQNAWPNFATTEFGSVFGGGRILMGSMDTALFTLPQIQARIQLAEALGQSVSFHTHDIGTTGDGSLITPTATFTGLMNYLAAEQAAGRLIVLKPSVFMRSVAASPGPLSANDNYAQDLVLAA